MIKHQKLTSISIRLPCECNLNCKYCYGNLIPKKDTLSYNEITNIIQQASELSIEHVYIVGEGEPLQYTHFRELIRYINGLHLVPIIYSNLTQMTEELSKYLFNQKAIIIGKQNSFNANIQDKICDEKGTYQKINQGLEYLVQTGFSTTQPTRLGIHTVILKENITELPAMWRYWRNNNIEPQVQVLVYPSEKNDEKHKNYYEELMPTPLEIWNLFNELSQIDKEEYAIIWDPSAAYPIAPIGCTIQNNNIGITQEGNVQICSYTEDPIGSIRGKSLKEILSYSKVKKIRSIGDILNYPKKGYGCRANALNITHNRYGRDPTYDEFLKSSTIKVMI